MSSVLKQAPQRREDRGIGAGEHFVNVAAYLPEMARRMPDWAALVWRSGRDSSGRARYSQRTFRELNEDVDRYAHGLVRAGIGRGLRTILMVRPRGEFFALTFALLKISAVPVLIDPGMGRRRMVECLAKVGAEAFIGIPLAHVLRVLHCGAFRSVRTCITVGRRWLWGGLRLEDVWLETQLDSTGGAGLRARQSRQGRPLHHTPHAVAPFEMPETHEDDPAAIIFTTGSTGSPKGVLYRHGMFAAQVLALREMLGIEPGEIDLPTFPLFALFDAALGMTAVLPEMDATRPAHVDPGKIIEAIRDQCVTNMFGSPALLDRVGRHGEANAVKLPTLRRVMSAGASVPPETLRRFRTMLSDDTEIFTPYGATEALPVACIGSREILEETATASALGAGTCVGRAAPGVEIRVIGISDEAIEEWSDDLMVGNTAEGGCATGNTLTPAISLQGRGSVGEIGEIVVRGSVVTREYCTEAEATRRAKIREGESIWHRMGDVGWLDERGRLWFCGRKAHRVVTEHGTLFTEPCEAVFNEHPKVFRTALVGVGEAPRQRPVLCVELEAEAKRAGAAEGERIAEELREMSRRHEHTCEIETILFHPAFPVDIRHNAKIFREKLAVWAARRVR